MTSTQQSLHMYAHSEIRFRDPFAVSKAITPPKTTSRNHEPPTTSWSSHQRYPDFTRALTPPPEMTGLQQPSSQTNYHSQEHGHHYGDYVPSQPTYRAPVAPCLPQEVSNTTFARNGTTAQVQSRASPARQSYVEANGDAQGHRRHSQTSTIAANFQIPRSVNESGGSLAELAAQITCLFWFESSDILQQVENSPIPLQPTRSLTPDAKPTTGFRKWVTTILSTTMVAQNVVVLALLFIYRLKKLNPTVKGKPGSEYRLLTVALMLGNKFLDDNTYTNKTWAEVSGINVGEVHIMEVEFLSNMKYCLFTSEQDWARWQSLLGKFAAFFDRASRPPPRAPILPPASSLHLPRALPSPPASNRTSPPYSVEPLQNGTLYNSATQHGPTPAPSPLDDPVGPTVLNPPASRKRSLDDHSTEPPSKRIASSYHNYTSPQRFPTVPAHPTNSQPIPRLTLPSLSIPASQNAYPQSMSQGQQLPPLTVPARAMAMVYPSASSQGHTTQLHATAGPSSQPQTQSQPQYGSRHHSPYEGSTATSPSSAAPQSATALHSTQQISPTCFLQQRSSPYRPIHHVSTLLYPPPSAAIQSRPPTVELKQMQYQALGKPIQHTGRLPYVSQNLWLDGNQPQEMTPIHQWPGMATFANARQQQQQQHMVSQQ